MCLRVFLCALAVQPLISGRADAQAQTPRALRDGISIERAARVAPQSIRVARDPVSGNLYYVTIGGDVYELRDTTSVRVATSDDHGITRLQGMVFSDSSLFLVGNVPDDDGRATRGRLMRGRMTDTGARVWTIVFTTDAIGATKTPFDHGFNGIAVSPDGRHLFVNSGARTDHGEIVRLEGEYPDARDEPLTAAVFRVPTSAHNVTLRNDLEELKREEYLYAEGIRNGFDLAFAPNGHLFIVSNSGDYDHPEDMFWLREGRHYGFPWVMGGVENPQQYPDFEADADQDPFINPRSHAYSVGFFHNDPDFPKPPQGRTFTPPVMNVGPDANFFRDRQTGRVLKGDEVGVALGTFTAHRSPLGLVFDADSLLTREYRGDGFVLSWTDGAQSVLLGRLSKFGSDLLHLDLYYSAAHDNYIVRSTRIAEGFNGPTDAELVGTDLYVLEYGGRGSSLWRLSMPAAGVSGPSSRLTE